MRTKTTPTNLECEVCRNIQIIQRKSSKKKTKGHAKHIYCYKCKEITKHIEIKEDAEMPAWVLLLDAEEHRVK